MATDDRVVIVGPWGGAGDGTVRTITLHAGWFYSQVVLARFLLADGAAWAALRRDVEYRLRQDIKHQMKDTGCVPIGEVLIEQTEDLIHDASIYRMRQRGMESDDPVWISIRDALAEDRADRAALRRGVTAETR